MESQIMKRISIVGAAAVLLGLAACPAYGLPGIGGVLDVVEDARNAVQGVVGVPIAPGIVQGNTNAAVHVSVPARPGSAGVSVNVVGGNRPDQWRYRWENGRWWYWTPQNRWMWYNDGQWIDYDPSPGYTTYYGDYYSDPNTGYYDYYPNSGFYYGYPNGWDRNGYQYRPGLSIGVDGIGIGVHGGHAGHPHHR
jgi:hypothetical protein